MCDREMPLTLHHMIPREVHEWYKNHHGKTKDQLHSGIMVCRDCHSAIHKFEDNKTLAAEYRTLETLMAHPKVIPLSAFLFSSRLGPGLDPLYQEAATHQQGRQEDVEARGSRPAPTIRGRVRPEPDDPPAPPIYPAPQLGSLTALQWTFQSVELLLARLSLSFSFSPLPRFLPPLPVMPVEEVEAATATAEPARECPGDSLREGEPRSLVRLRPSPSSSASLSPRPTSFLGSFLPFSGGFGELRPLGDSSRCTEPRLVLRSVALFRGDRALMDLTTSLTSSFSLP